MMVLGPNAYHGDGAVGAASELTTTMSIRSYLLKKVLLIFAALIPTAASAQARLSANAITPPARSAASSF
jgi:hypothetical protein